MITVTGYNWVPDFARGLVRDLRVRWALEEAGLAYQAKLNTHEEKLTSSLSRSATFFSGASLSG